MLYPPMSELLTHIDSRYLLVNVVARRARQISIESKEFGEPLTERYLRAARDTRLAPYFTETDAGFALTAEGFLLSNRLIAEVLYKDEKS